MLDRTLFRKDRKSSDPKISAGSVPDFRGDLFVNSVYNLSLKTEDKEFFLLAYAVSCVFSIVFLVFPKIGRMREGEIEYR